MLGKACGVRHQSVMDCWASPKAVARNSQSELVFMWAALFSSSAFHFWWAGFVSGTRAQSTAGNKNRQKICRGSKTRRPGDLCTSLYKNSVEFNQRVVVSWQCRFISLNILEDNACKTAHLFTETKCKPSAPELKG